MHAFIAKLKFDMYTWSKWCYRQLQKNALQFLKFVDLLVNFTNILWAAFAPKSFRQNIANPNCKHLKPVQRTLVWLSISPIFYKQLFLTKVPGVNFTNILWAAFAPKSFRQNIANPNCKRIKVVQKTFAQKSCS